MIFELTTSDNLVYSEEIDLAIIPTEMGYITVLNNHTSLLAKLSPGEVEFRYQNQSKFVAVSGGFVEILDNKITLFADSAERSEEIDEQRSTEALNRAKEALNTAKTSGDFRKARFAIQKSQTRIQIARRRRNINRPTI